jgi:hypothetical protein
MEHNSNAFSRDFLSCLDGATWTGFAQNEGLDKISGGVWAVVGRGCVGGGVRDVAGFFN